ncbi:hypothetical protein ACFXA3_35870 [Streptomyces sp. NPDC059456]|uniref:hypothetical protein n=1 Tax=Streptomyces sp. NPDC059456 TaxID=3346838 RepID=UPI0036C288BC
MSDPHLPHAPYMAAVHAALAAEGLRVRNTWTNGLTRRASSLHITDPADVDGGFRFEDGQFDGTAWSEPESVWLWWEHHHGWCVMDEDSGLLPVAYHDFPLPLPEPFADPRAVAATVRRWLPGPTVDVPAPAGRWSQADAVEAGIRVWHEQYGRCLTPEDRHVVRIDGVARPDACPCPDQPCGGVASRDIRGDCPWHIGERHSLQYHHHWSGHAPEACPGPADRPAPGRDRGSAAPV